MRLFRRVTLEGPKPASTPFLFYLVKTVVVALIFAAFVAICLTKANGNNLISWKNYASANSAPITTASQQLQNALATSLSSLPSSNSTHKKPSPLVGDDDEEDDGNTKLCHKIALYKGDQCAFAVTNCQNAFAGGYLNYLIIRFCTFRSVGFLFYFAAFLMVLLLFYLLSDTAEAFFCPSLTEISRYLKLSPDVAGVTFLALGNGAPDISSIVAGVFTGSVGFGIGEPIGAGVFVTTGVMAAVTLLANTKVEIFPFLRDVGTYLLSVIYVLFLFFTGKIYLWQSLLCLAIYFVYVMSVIFGKLLFNIFRKIRDRRLLAQAAAAESLAKTGNKKNSQPINSEKTGLLSGSTSGSRYYDTTVTEIEEESSDEEEVRWHKNMRPRFDLQIEKLGELHEDKNLQKLLKRSESAHFGNYFLPKVGMMVPSGVSKQIEGLHKHHLKSKLKEKTEAKGLASQPSVIAIKNHEHTGSIVIENHFKAPKPEEIEEEEETYKSSIQLIWEEFLEWIEWDEMAWYSRILFFLQSPLILARNLTIPKADPEEWSRLLAVISPPFILTFAAAVTGLLNITFPYSSFRVIYIAPIVGLILSIVIFFTTEKRKPPVYHVIFVAAAFVMSILWIYLTANEMVDLLQSIGVMWQVSDAILAVTVLAWGNSLGDMVADVVVAREGFPQMAVGAIYGGPCLNLLIGLGIAITTHCIKEPFFEVEFNPGVLLSFVFLLASLVAVLIVVPLSGFRSPKPFGIMLLALYVVFMVLSFLIESNVLWTE